MLCLDMKSQVGQCDIIFITIVASYKIQNASSVMMSKSVYLFDVYLIDSGYQGYFLFQSVELKVTINGQIVNCFSHRLHRYLTLS